MRSEFKVLAGPEGLRKMLEGYAAEFVGHPDFKEPTFRCPKCLDSGFLVRKDSASRLYGSRCECLTAEIVAYRTNKPKGPAFKDTSGATSDELPF